MAEQAPDKNDWEEKLSETSLQERDTSEINVDLVEETLEEDETNVFNENKVDNLLQNIKHELENELSEKIKTLSVNEIAADESQKADENIEVPIVPIEDPYEKATKYFAKHNILGLFQNITADIAYKKPEDPIQFMIDEIEKLQEIDRRRKGVILRKTRETKSGESGASIQNLLTANDHFTAESDEHLTGT